MAFKVGGCAGHGGYRTLNPKTYATAGKRTPDGEPEWIFNDKVIRAFEDELNKYQGVEFRRFDDSTGKTDVPLKTRTDRANNWNADIYISFHHNANTGSWGNWTGIETYTQVGVRGKAVELAKLVHPAMIKAYGLRDRGLKTKDLHITRETKMPAVLLEGGYMDSRIDIVKMRDNSVLENAGRLVAQAVAKYANLKLKEQPKPVESKPVSLPKEEEEMLERAIVIGGYPEFDESELVAVKLKAPIYFRNALPQGKVAKEVYVIGGSSEGLIADKIINLSGKDRVETLKNVISFLGK